jgi:hypothetical protein
MHWCLTPVILATREAEIRRITVRSQPAQTVCDTLSRKTPITKNWAGGMVQGPELHTHTQKKKNKCLKTPDLVLVLTDSLSSQGNKHK